MKRGLPHRVGEQVADLAFRGVLHPLVDGPVARTEGLGARAVHRLDERHVVRLDRGAGEHAVRDAERRALAGEDGATERRKVGVRGYTEGLEQLALRRAAVRRASRGERESARHDQRGKDQIHLGALLMEPHEEASAEARTLLVGEPTCPAGGWGDLGALRAAAWCRRWRQGTAGARRRRGGTPWCSGSQESQERATQNPFAQIETSSRVVRGSVTLPLTCGRHGEGPFAARELAQRGSV